MKAPEWRERTIAELKVIPGRNSLDMLIISLSAAVLIVLVGRAHYEWRAHAEIKTVDTPEFTDAARRWVAEMQTMVGANPTPRALKRFRNRARYYAMMRRESADPEFRDGFNDAALVALSAAEQAGALERSEAGFQLLKVVVDRLKPEAIRTPASGRPAPDLRATGA
jgi:hypothetical protein